MMTRRTPVSCAASSRLLVPSPRSRLVSSKSRAIVFGLIRAGIAVAMCTTASGSAARTARRTAWRSSRSVPLPRDTLITS